MKKFKQLKRSVKAAMIGTAATLAVGAAALGFYLTAPSGYIALDVNPSLEIRTNRLNHVTSVEAANEDGRKLLEGYRLDDHDLDDVIEDLVDRMLLQGYLGGTGENDVLVTVEDGTVSPDTVEQVNHKIAAYLEYRRVDAHVMNQSITLSQELKDKAQQYGVSAGKMSVIDRLVAGDPTLTPQDLAQTRISDILNYAQEKGISLAFLEQRLDDMEDRLDDQDDEHVDALADGVEDVIDPDDDADDRYDDVDDRDDDADDRHDDVDDRDDDADDRYDDDDDRADDADDRYDDVDDRDDDADDRDDDMDDRDDDADDRYDDDDDDINDDDDD